MDDTVRISHCRFCAEKKPETLLIDLSIDPLLLSDVVDKLKILKIDFIDFSLKNHLPKTICVTCYNTYETDVNFTPNLLISQRRLKDIYPSLIPADNEDSSADESEEYSNHIPVETILQPDSEDKKCDKSSFNFFNQPVYRELASSSNSYQVQSYTVNPQTQLIVAPNKSKPAEEKDSWDEYIWVCMHCDEIAEFDNLSGLRAHLNSEHRVCFGFRCIDCFKKIDNFVMFVRHVRNHRKKLCLYCHICNQKFDTKEQTAAHAALHPSPSCRRCGQEFPTSKLLKHHTSKFRASNLKVARVEGRRSRCVVQRLPSSELKGIKDKSWDGYPFRCSHPACAAPAADVHGMRQHARLLHGTCFSMRCADCAKPMTSYLSFVSHVRRHRPYLRRYCLYCNYDFEKGDPYSVHLPQHFVGESKICDGCGEIFPTKNDLERHRATFNPPGPRRMRHMAVERPLIVDDLTCDICSKVTGSVQALKAHKLLHKDREKSFSCQKCTKRFYQKRSLQIHMQIHTEEGPKKDFVCAICKFAFQTRSQLKSHVQTHTTDRPYQCPECDKSFRSKSHLSVHRLTHTDIMRYKCEFCEKGFRYKNNWTTHLNQHTGQRPYRCTECDAGFASWSNCNKHMIRRHGITLAKTKRTAHGKLPINRRTGEPVLDNMEIYKEWTEQILVSKQTKSGF